MTDLPLPEGLEELNLEVPVDGLHPDGVDYIDEDEIYNVIESDSDENYALNNAIRNNTIYPQN